MTSLEAGVRYTLSSPGHLGESKSLVFVKLTDSAQRCVEEYVRSRGKPGQQPQRPTIQFLGNEGQLLFPAAGKAEQGRFTFSLASDQDAEGAQGAQGGFECVRRTGPRELESLGALLCRMRVHANDDIFETTRSRMQAVEVSNKNKCTRVLKSNETVGKKVKVRGTVRKILPSPAAPAAPVAPAAAPVAPAGGSPKQRPAAAPAQRGPARPAGPAGGGAQRRGPEVARRTLRERLVHLLALRPFKKPELYERLHQDGLREQERRSLATVLKQVSRMQGNAYHLLAGAWGDVQDDWPFYSDEERAALKRRKPQGLTPPGSSDASSGHSPSSARSDSPPPPRIVAAPGPPPPPGCAKRAPHEPPAGQANGFPQKRQRVSDYRRPEAGFLQEVAQQPRAALQPGRAQPPAAQDYLREFGSRAEAEDSDNNGSPADPDYMQAYTTIRSLEQRARYKADFLCYFEDYQRVHLQLSEITKHFVVLKEELKRKEDLGDSRGYEEAKQKIIDEYSRTKHVKLRFQYLHEKLEYIKKLVADYDNQHFKTNRAY